MSGIYEREMVAAQRPRRRDAPMCPVPASNPAE